MKGDIKTGKKDEPKEANSNVDRVILGDLFAKGEIDQPKSKLMAAATSKEAKKQIKQKNDSQRQ